MRLKNKKNKAKANFFAQGKAGFSLVELMVVIGILSIMAAIAVPNFISWLPDMRLKSAARDLYSNFQRAKIVAVKNNTNVVVSFNVGADRYVIFVDDGGTTGTANDDTQNGDEQILTNVTLPADVNLQGVNFSLASTTPGFTPAALPLKSRIGNVVLDNANGRLYKITLSIAGGLKLE
jgi:type IV fimbrial biogenesis protein FimT